MNDISHEQQIKVDGGFVPLVIAGYYISAQTVMIVSGVLGAAATYVATH